SADIATGKKTIVGVLRLASGDSASGLPTGGTYQIEWTQTQKGSDGKPATFWAAFTFYVYATGGASGSYGVSTDPNFAPTEPSPAPAVTATMDSNGVITWVMKRKDVSVATGAKFTELSASTSIADNFQLAGGSLRGLTQTMDTATGHASYADQQQGCVRAS
ncbi:MAG: hypothetical protein JO079_15195, partial [Frankiaceae bacterium]|nr:hypothetical protein [Frankiaceae bacterium]